jgi:hypothetical protein
MNLINFIAFDEVMFDKWINPQINTKIQNRNKINESFVVNLFIWVIIIVSKVKVMNSVPNRKQE